MVRFNPKARLDTSRMRDGGGSSGGGGFGGGSGGGMRLPIPTGRGGIGGIIVLVLLFVVAQCAGIDLGLGGGSSPSASNAYSPARFTEPDGSADGRYADCKTGEDANDSPDCARVAVENSLNDYWESELGGKFRPERAMVTFSGGVDTQCGQATSATGPFYCPADEAIYLDTTFFDDVFEQQLGGSDGAFVEPYVLAHEFGHHVSNLLGFLGEVRSGTGPQSDGVRLELQADCYAGLWAKHATETEDASGEVLILDLTQQDIDEAISAARTVGDDYIQKRSGGRVDQEAWTHGSSEQRQKWFMVGYEQGTLDACDTFSADKV